MPRAESKTSQVIAMLKREGGTTLEEIMTAMGWQKHTTRAMLSFGGSLTKNHGSSLPARKLATSAAIRSKPDLSNAAPQPPDSTPAAFLVLSSESAVPPTNPARRATSHPCPGVPNEAVARCPRSRVGSGRFMQPPFRALPQRHRLFSHPRPARLVCPCTPASAG
jgi:hypothetical protein